MIGRRLLVLQDAQGETQEELFLEIPYVEEWKHLTIKNVKKHSYSGLVTVIRLYVRSSNFIKNKYEKIITEIDKKRKEHIIKRSKKEVSRFLKTVSDYKHKIREIKHRVVEEEEERNS
ncbi:MAG: hypothetical protein WA060_03190 [Minisyncoccia bacterium]